MTNLTVSSHTDSHDEPHKAILSNRGRRNLLLNKRLDFSPGAPILRRRFSDRTDVAVGTAAKRRLTLDRVEHELPPLESLETAMVRLDRVGLWAAAGMLTGGVASAVGVDGSLNCPVVGGGHNAAD